VKKKTKIIILISILLIIAMLMFGFYILCQFEDYTVIIRRIEEDNILVESPQTIIKTTENGITELQYPKYYIFSAKDVSIKDSNGHKISVSELKVGDTIYIINKKERNKPDIGMSWEGYGLYRLYNVKLIKVSNDNLDKTSK
jgi:hypothetical protein